MKRTTLFFVSLVLAGAATAAQVYKWKDADGKLHYSDTPPVSGPQVKMMPMQAKDQPVSAIVTPKAAPIVGAKNASGPGATAPAAQEQSEKDPKACQQARSRKAFLESGQLTKSVNEKGEVEYMSEQKRKAELEDAQKAIDRFCP